MHELTTTDLDRLRQWFNSMEDTNPKYVEAEDRELYARILVELAQRKLKPTQ